MYRFPNGWQYINILNREWMVLRSAILRRRLPVLQKSLDVFSDSRWMEYFVFVSQTYFFSEWDALKACCDNTTTLAYCDFSKWIYLDDSGNANPKDNSTCANLVAHLGFLRLWITAWVIIDSSNFHKSTSALNSQLWTVYRPIAKQLFKFISRIIWRFVKIQLLSWFFSTNLSMQNWDFAIIAFDFNSKISRILTCWYIHIG